MVFRTFVISKKCLLNVFQTFAAQIFKTHSIAYRFIIVVSCHHLLRSFMCSSRRKKSEDQKQIADSENIKYHSKSQKLVV